MSCYCEESEESKKLSLLKALESLREEEIIKMCDLNKDGTVNDPDLEIIEKHYGTKRGDELYRADMDLNKDGKIDIYDVALICRHYGKSWK